jgi:cell wall-associated NlpC family hydrolase
MRSTICQKMKNQVILLSLMLGMAGCSAFRPASRNADNPSEENTPHSGKKSQPSFLSDISTPSGSGTTAVNEPVSPILGPAEASSASAGNNNINVAQLQFKYSILTNTPVEELTNQRLLIFMDQWYGVHYQYGGSTKDGIDCSAFASLLLADVYDVKKLPRISADQYTATRHIPKRDLKEGDLVFFHTLGKGHRVTHVGVYLYNNRFIHASIAGVQISDLSDGYYLHHYVGAGRVIAE